MQSHGKNHRPQQATCLSQKRKTVTAKMIAYTDLVYFIYFDTVLHLRAVFVFYASSLQRFLDENFTALGRQHFCKNKRNGYNTDKPQVTSGGSRTFSLGAVGEPWYLVGCIQIATTTGLLLRTILCKSLILMPRVKFVEKYTKHAC